MKICIHSDVHWCQNSSIVRSRGYNYSRRLENLVNSVNWVERLAWDQGADCIICCGDFFDSSMLNSEEISALQEIKWAPLSHLFLTGNHETNVSSLEYSTTDLFKLCPNVAVINTPQQYFIDNGKVEFCFLPYILERDRRALSEYFGPQTCNRVIFSHNDLKDVQYGSFLSTEGFEISDIETNCNLYFNGHIHHCYNVTSKVINIGNLTGQNFTEDATKYNHCAIILDTDSLQYTFHQNPYAFNFYKLDLTNCVSYDDLLDGLKIMNDMRCSVVTVTVPEHLSIDARGLLDNLKEFNLCEYRLIIKHADNTSDVLNVNNVDSSDHLKQFEQYVLLNIGTSDIVKQELHNIMR